MAATARLTSHPFPVGTVVAAYKRPGARGEGAPAGAPTETATVAADGSLTFVALDEPQNGWFSGGVEINVPYAAYGLVAGAHRWVWFSARKDLSFHTG